MEPGQQRENPLGSGEPESGEWREESAAVETGERDDTLKNRSGDGGNEEITSKTENTVVAEKDKAEFDEDEEQYEEELDPRIQEELEHLNQASDEINRLELQLDEARSSYRRILTDSARKLNAQGSQLGACIEKARPYYEARRLAKEAQQETQKAALRYERAVSMHTAAREMVYVAEQGLLADRNTLDPTWQEMLNHATAKVNEAEEERLRSEREHQHVTQLCQEAEARVQTLQKALKRVIIKSKPYFELKAQFNHILEEHKSKVVQLEERVAKVKTRYSVALRNLEQISEQIHAQRGRIRAARERNRARGGRSSPVGAESEGVIQSGVYAGVVANPLMDNDWADQEKTRQWVEKHRDAGWGRRERAEKAGSDSMSVISLQTIASDLEKFDSVEHLGDLSDVGSIIGEEKEAESERGFRVDDRIVEREVANLSRQDAEKGASGADRQQRDRERESFVKQHHRSISL
ncbi:SH3 domain-binding protein 5-like [Sinocyclocheilus rhinocerous]|uniref:SH3 domain-binding protein 5-like n=1 Tax=Sinocyclocheilus rhinocerous TaxID=307959 RepID=UPI0007B9858A|nr:PREDICTED: SH3 domain-binding protein 5-like [Sinocyclocheilus rhinocerous]XP_016371789.1 PREDICTED: SH3 domain-binding protein 5-like [Sinocyclocheilus rhinocerous]